MTERMTQKTNDYTWRRVGTCGCEILGSDGIVVAWAADDLWAAIIVHVLNTADLPSMPPERIKSRDVAGMGAGHNLRRDMRSENLGFMAVGEPTTAAFSVAPV